MPKISFTFRVSASNRYPIARPTHPRRVGECEVGDEMAERYRKDMGKAGHYLFSNVASVPDDRGCSRPVTIWSNPRYANDGHGGHYLIKGADQKALCARYAAAVEKYENIEGKIELLNRVTEKQKGTERCTVKGVERALEDAKQRVQKARELTKVAAYPAYLSVGIWFETKPSQKQVEILKQRAALFPRVYLDANKRYGKQKEIKIESFRLVEFNKTSSEQNL